MTRQQTVLVELGRNLDFWCTLNHYLPDQSQCEDVYLEIDSEYQALEDDIDENEGLPGVDENNEVYTVLPYTNRKPPITRPTFPF